MGNTLIELLRRHAEERPDSPCLTLEADHLSFSDLNARSSRLANAMSARGVAAGDRVAMVARTAIQSFELLFACAKIGAILLPINWRLSAREVSAILADGDPRLVLVSADLVTLLADDIAGRDRIELDADYAAWRDSFPAVDPAHDFMPDDPLLLLYTSGTTGLPKGVVITQRNMTFVDRTAREIWGFGRASVNLVAMPLYHIGGIGYGMMALSQGGHTVLVPQAEATIIVDAMHKYDVTHGFFVPTVIQRIVDEVEARGAAPSSLQLMIYGASRIGQVLLKRAIEVLGCGFSNAYGMTETSGTVVSMGPEDHDPERAPSERLASCGRQLPWAEIILADPATGVEVPIGEVGEIRVRSDANMLGYWNKPVETDATITPDGWLCTGDAASRDADGYIYIQDRYKDMIISGGENIYPAEIENTLQNHPDISEIAVIGVPHPVWGETPRAFVVAREKSCPSDVEIIDFARQHLARYKCPTSVTFVTELPRNVSGKVLKRSMRDEAWLKAHS